MSEIIHYRQCPACRSAAISKVFNCVDHTVTGKSFEVWTCSTCTLRFTQNVPTHGSIDEYYKSNNYISHTDTKKGIVNTLYHQVRKLTLKSKQSLISKVTGKLTGNLLDAGAGTGAFANTMQQAGWLVSGIEPDPTARQNALARYNLQFEAPEKIETLLPNNFDAITLWHVLEHVHDLHGYLASFHRLLKPEGYLFIAVPNYTSYDAVSYGNCWAAYDVPRHLYHFSPRSMELLLQAHGFTIKQIKPMWFDSFYVSMLSEKIRGNHGVLLGGFWKGLLSNFKTLKATENCSSLIYVVKKRQ